MQDNKNVTAKESRQHFETKYDRSCSSYFVNEEEYIHMSNLFERERNLQRRLYGASWPWDISRFIKDYGMHLHMETDEMIREVHYKMQTKMQKEIDHDLLKGEIADVFIFALAAATAEFKTYDEFIKVVRDKIQYNENRQDWDINKH